MLIEFVPVMLFILGWSPDDPSQIDLQRHPVLFASIEACERASAGILADYTEVTPDGVTPRQFVARCVKFPEEAEVDALFETGVGKALDGIPHRSDAPE